ncbi:phosphate butyryltransferase [Bacillus sp. HMF5848]|uniref:phosphate butyryltransferase n=1 Tax=Bacillus sp. HMF5848 TaxID=2495421 RepID=UPI000F79F987|nr:phosphate butyryltransferase [Bacillus sp. HMF5848]RSK27781.1 phosphate butyryltransferase [Bacillus sp. HMF5848]
MRLSDIVAYVTQQPSKKIAVAAADDEQVLAAVNKALQQNLASFILYGKKNSLRKLVAEANLSSYDVNALQIVETESDEEAAYEAVKAVRFEEADVLMKGNLHTSQLLKHVLNKEQGLRVKNQILSHVAAFDIPGWDRLIYITDAAMNIAPTLEQKAQIIQNAVNVTRRVNLDVPKVAVLAAVETVNSAMEASIHAGLLAMMNKRGQIQHCLVDGPLALDNAVSKQAAQYKKIDSEVAGEADILVLPDIETGNVLYKSLVYFANASTASIIAGAKAPIVLTSRADSIESKLLSVAFAIKSNS